MHVHTQTNYHIQTVEHTHIPVVLCPHVVMPLSGYFWALGELLLRIRQHVSTMYTTDPTLMRESHARERSTNRKCSWRRLPVVSHTFVSFTSARSHKESQEQRQCTIATYSSGAEKVPFHYYERNTLYSK